MKRILILVGLIVFTLGVNFAIDFLRPTTLRAKWIETYTQTYAVKIRHSAPDTAVCASQILAARALASSRIDYEPSYIKISYPGGDVPADTGVCADVVVRSFRSTGIDLQRLVHEDMSENFASYPALWSLNRPDTNIDHRRVPNL